LSGGCRHQLVHQASTGAFMNVRQLKQFCRGFGGATETLYEDPYNFLVYAVGGRKFAYFKTSRPEQWRFSTRVAPDRFIELTDIPGVKPARYRGRFHWITIVNVSSFPARYLKELVGWSYQRAFASLSKNTQRHFANMIVRPLEKTDARYRAR
jgi:predicted DNA-binding protein (MmcQ/YjbR family)